MNNESGRNSSESLMERRHGDGPRVVIIGMPGAGKTRIGKEISSMLKLSFIDSDVAIERQEGASIPSIFQDLGEDAFRDIESDVVIQALHDHDGVLSLGGGAPIFRRTRKALERYRDNGGLIAYLDADPEEMIERAFRSRNRPLLEGDARSRWLHLYDERRPVFEQLANIVISTHRAAPAVGAHKLINAMKERIVHVSGSDPYDVRIGDGVFEHLRQLLGSSPVRVALIHTMPVQRHSDAARAQLRSWGYEVLDISIPDAEAGKTVQVAGGIWKRLADEGFTRSDAVVGLGGGAATDVAGFIAATWMRGIAYVNCPTSLLAMVDASTGGKTGVNIPEGKNLVGSFYTPQGVLADTRFLSTLPNDIFIEGLGEVVKSGFIMDTRILDIVQENSQALHDIDCAHISPEMHDVIAELIERTVSVKSKHVSADLKESGMREFLNYGHTLGHAIEQIEHFRWRHGQAVAVGMVFAAELANILGYIDDETVEFHRSILSSVGLKTSWNGGDFASVLALMHKDKKARGNTLRFIVLDRIGHPIHLDNPPESAVREAFDRIRNN